MSTSEQQGGRTSFLKAQRSDTANGMLLVAAMVALMWVVEVIDTIDSHRLDQHGGIVPRQFSGLDGVVFSPFLHAGFGHLISNTIPFLLLGAVVALSGAMRVLVVTVIIALVGGLGTWLIAPSHSVTIGASGIVMGYATYLIARGVFSRRVLELALGVIVGVLWGGALIWSLVPREGVSWQAHLCGGIGGVVAAWILTANLREAREQAKTKKGTAVGRV